MHENIGDGFPAEPEFTENSMVSMESLDIRKIVIIFWLKDRSQTKVCLRVSRISVRQALGI